jgi:hypothetical protein
MFRAISFIAAPLLASDHQPSAPAQARRTTAFYQIRRLATSKKPHKKPPSTPRTPRKTPAHSCLPWRSSRPWRLFSESAVAINDITFPQNFKTRQSFSD